MEAYDIFVSYRRDGGFETAQIIYDRLNSLGYRVFLDIETLRSGKFNTRLYQVIDESQDFIVILSPDCLDRCAHSEDWLRLEIARALKSKKNIVPILTRNFSFPRRDQLPPEISDIVHYNGPTASREYFPAFISKLQEFLTSSPRGSGGKGPQSQEVRDFSGHPMIWCPPGTFLMGDPSSSLPESRQHRVTLSRGFWLGKYQVTLGQWMEVMGKNPCSYKKKAFPVSDVSWELSKLFIRKLNEKLGYTFRMPSEAEWEYACRAGTRTEFSCGESLSPEYACYDSKSYTPTAVGSLLPNPWGFHDMHGNMWEWCSDWYGKYPENPVVDPAGPKEAEKDFMEAAKSGFGSLARSLFKGGSFFVSEELYRACRIARGGCYYLSPYACSSYYRNSIPPDKEGESVGLRLACDQLE